VIRPPWAGTEGLRLEADGIRFVGSDGFEVLEWKGLDNEPLFTKIDSPEALQAAAEARTRGQTSPPGLTYIDEPGRLAGEPQNYEKLRADMNRDSQYFQELRGLGCRGMVWMTNSPGMARAFEQVMAELHLEGIVPMGPQ
jgi:hypothetical protein